MQWALAHHPHHAGKRWVEAHPTPLAAAPDGHTTTAIRCRNSQPDPDLVAGYMRGNVMTGFTGWERLLGDGNYYGQ